MKEVHSRCDSVREELGAQTNSALSGDLSSCSSLKKNNLRSKNNNMI